MKPLHKLRPNSNLMKLAEKHTYYLGDSGRFSHEDEEGNEIGARLKSLTGKNEQAYEDIIAVDDTNSFQLIIKILLTKSYYLIREDISYIGCSVSKHKKFGYICVINYSNGDFWDFFSLV